MTTPDEVFSLFIGIPSVDAPNGLHEVYACEVAGLPATLVWIGSPTEHQSSLKKGRMVVARGGDGFGKSVEAFGLVVAGARGQSAPARLAVVGPAGITERGAAADAAVLGVPPIYTDKVRLAVSTRSLKKDWATFWLKPESWIDSAGLTSGMMLRAASVDVPQAILGRAASACVLSAARAAGLPEGGKTMRAAQLLGEKFGSSDQALVKYYRDWFDSHPTDDMPRSSKVSHAVQSCSQLCLAELEFSRSKREQALGSAVEYAALCVQEVVMESHDRNSGTEWSQAGTHAIKAMGATLRSELSLPTLLYYVVLQPRPQH